MSQPSNSPEPISKKPLHPIIPALILLPSIAVILSFFMTWAQGGFNADFFSRWARGFVTTLVILPLTIACISVVERMVDKVIGHLHWVTRKLAVAAIAACLFETVIGFAVTAVGHPFDASFAGNWWLAFSRALPAGLVIGLFMTFYMKPKLDRMRQASLNRR